jgi:hypothetical protein
MRTATSSTGQMSLVNNVLMKMRRRNISDSRILLSKKLEGDRLLRSLLATVLSSLPKAYVNPITLALRIATKAVNFAIMPLSIVDVACLVMYPASAILLSVDKVAFIEMSLSYDLYAKPIFLDPTLFVKTHIAEVGISGIVEDDGFGDGGHQ